MNDPSVTASDQVDGRSEDGIYVITAASSNLVTIDATKDGAGYVKGAVEGIEVVHYGAGTLKIDADQVTSQSRLGIAAVSYGAGDIEVETNGLITAPAGAGIVLGVFGPGGIEVTANGDIDAGVGISAYAAARASDIEVTAANIDADFVGISTSNRGTGKTEITANGTIRAGGDGISAYTAGTDISIMATGSVSGGQTGVFVYHNGSGYVSVTANAVTGTNEYGIHVETSATATGVDIDTTGPVTGGQTGIKVGHRGTGNVTVTASDKVEGETLDGIYVETLATSNLVTIDATNDGAGYVKGAVDGIEVKHFGDGLLKIDADQGARVTLNKAF